MNSTNNNSDDLYDVQTRAAGPSGELPFTADMLLTQTSGNAFVYLGYVARAKRNLR